MSSTPTTKPDSSANLDLQEITQIVELMAKNNLSFFQLERTGASIVLRRGHDLDAISDVMSKLPAAAPSYAPAHMTMAPAPAAAAPALAAAPAPASAAAPAAAAEPTGPVITSPMVGTFYSAAEPGAKPFISIGQTVDENTTVCIIEAMKVMNEIKAEKRGTVVRVLATDGKPVQFGQQLFELK